MSSELGGKVELDVFEIFLGHGENITRVSEEHITALLVLRHVLVLTLLKILELRIIVALYPTSLVEMHRFPTTLRVVFVLQAILNHLKLQLTYGTDDLPIVELVDKQLRHALVHELIDTLLQLFGAHGIIVLDVFEELWRE